MADSSQSQGSDAPVTPRRREASSNKQKWAEHSHPISGSGAKRLKKTFDQSHVAITDTKSPSNSPRSPAYVSAMAGPGRTPTSHSSSKSRHSVTSLNKATSPAPIQTPRLIPLPEGVLDTGRHKHHGFSWLYKDRTDKNRRKPDDPQYNPRTLYVPPSFLKEETPAMRQWWAFKCENMDTVLFFKVSRCSMLSRWLSVISLLLGTRVDCFDSLGSCSRAKVASVRSIANSDAISTILRR